MDERMDALEDGRMNNYTSGIKTIQKSLNQSEDILFAAYFVFCLLNLERIREWRQEYLMFEGKGLMWLNVSDPLKPNRIFS